MLQNTERFKTDLKRYKESIDQIQDDQEKITLQRLLNDLIYEVKNMDNMYMDMVYAKQLPSMGKEMRDKIIDIRKKLDNRLKSVSKI